MMQAPRVDLSERLLNFGARIVGFAGSLNRSGGGRHVANQLLRAATSSGANYEEACAAESRADFVHKLQIVLKELRESLYWLKLARKAGMIAADSVDPLVAEADALAKIIGKSIVTARKRVRTEQFQSSEQQDSESSIPKADTEETRTS